MNNRHKVIKRCMNYINKKKVMSLTVLGVSSIYISTQIWGPKLNNSFVRACIAGTTASTICDLGLYPIDTLNTRDKAKRNECIGFIRSAKDVIKTKGLPTLYSGIQASYLFYPYSYFIYFLCYEKCRKLLPKYIENKTICSFLAPMISATVSIYLYYPADVLKTRLQVIHTKRHYEYIDEGIYKMKEEFMEGGIRAIYSGIVPFLMMYISFLAVTFGIYTTFMDYFNVKYKKEKRSLTHMERGIQVLLCSTFAGGMAGLLTNAFEAMCICRQLHPNLSLLKIVQSQRSALLVRGLFARILLSICGSALNFSLIELIYLHFNTNFTEWE